MKFKVIKQRNFYQVEGQCWNETIKQYCKCWTECYSFFKAYRIIASWYFDYIFKIDRGLK